MKNEKTTKLTKFAIAGAGLAGALTVGTAFGTVGAGAQDGDANDAATSTDSESGEKTQKRSGARKSAAKASLEGLGLSTEVVKEGRQAGQTLAEIAEANGISQDDLVAAIVEGANAKAESNDKEVDVAELTEKVTERVTSAKEAKDGKGRKGKMSKLDDADKEAFKAAIDTEDYDAAKALLLENLAEKVEAGDVDADKAADITERIEAKDFSESSVGKRGHKGQRGEKTEAAA